MFVLRRTQPFVFFLIALRTVPILSPVPYTTLFRSHRVLLPHALLAALGHRRPPGRKPLVHRGERRPGRSDLSGWLDLDRKITRLNSSHLVISYAVFCLKKKKLTAYIFLLV